MWGHEGVGQATETNVLHRIRKTSHISHELMLLLDLTQRCCKDAAAYCHTLLYLELPLLAFLGLYTLPYLRASTWQRLGLSASSFLNKTLL